jgi:hypothetical protein
MPKVVYLNSHTEKLKTKIDQQKGYIIYYQEIKTSKSIVKLEIKILKTDVNNLQKQLIKKQIDNLVKLYPLEHFKKLRFYLKSQDIPFITKLPFQEHKGYMVMIFKPNETAENYYENENGDLQEVNDEILDWKLYDGTFKKKPSKLRIIK